MSSKKAAAKQRKEQKTRPAQELGPDELIAAARRGDLGAVERLVDGGMDVNALCTLPATDAQQEPPTAVPPHDAHVAAASSRMAEIQRRITRRSSRMAEIQRIINLETIAQQLMDGASAADLEALNDAVLAFTSSTFPPNILGLFSKKPPLQTL